MESATEASPLLLLLLVLAAAELSSCAVHRVGDSSGWTIIGNINYKAWASSREFHVGDTLLFAYNKQFHDVVEVTKKDYRACNAAAPLTFYASGNDSVTIRRKGRTFFICGFPGHCELGQKVDIRVPKVKTTVVDVPVPQPGSAREWEVPPMAPATRGGADRLSVGWVGLGGVAWMAMAGAMGVWLKVG